MFKISAPSPIALPGLTGGPEAPSSPLQGGAAPGAACGCAGVADFCPEKTLPRKFEIPSPEDWAWASTASNTVAASTAAAARPTIDPVLLIMPFPSLHCFRVSKGLVTVSNGLTRDKARNYHHTSVFVPGCKPATNVQLGYDPEKWVPVFRNDYAQTKSPNPALSSPFGLP